MLKYRVTIFGANSEETMMEWRRLRNEELYYLYASLNIIPVIELKRMSWTGRLSLMGHRRVAYRVLMEKSEGKKQLGRRSFRWNNDNFKIGLQETRWGHELDRIKKHELDGACITYGREKISLQGLGGEI